MKSKLSNFCQLPAISVAMAGILFYTGGATAQDDPFTEAKALERRINAAFPTSYRVGTVSFQLDLSRNNSGNCRLRMKNQMTYAKGGGKSTTWFDEELTPDHHFTLSQIDFLGDSILTTLYSNTPDGRDPVYRYFARYGENENVKRSWKLNIPVHVGMYPAKKVLEYRTIQKYFRAVSNACGNQFQVFALPN